MRVQVDFGVCDSNGLCVDAAPELFAIGDNDLMDVLNPTPGPELWPAAEAAVRACPKLAISLVDES